jgi:hypothetical protein
MGKKSRRDLYHTSALPPKQEKHRDVKRENNTKVIHDAVAAYTTKVVPMVAVADEADEANDVEVSNVSSEPMGEEA